MMNKRENKKIQEIKAANALEGIEGNVGDVSNKIDLLITANTKISRN